MLITTATAHMAPISADEAADLRALHAVERVDVDLTDPRLARITRLRLISDRGFPLWDLSHCYGELRDGTQVRVSLPQSQWPKRNLTGALIGMCREAGVYGKGLGILDAVDALH